jgi:adenosine kinase
VPRIAVTGSIATDQLMRFRGRFADQLLAGELEHLSVSFLVEEMVLRRGGTGANIAFGLGVLGLNPLLVGSVGADSGEYRGWLAGHGVDLSGLRVSATAHTARFVCTTDDAQCQIASFYPGAMSESREIELAPLAEAAGGLELVLVSPNDPGAMLRHTEECRARGFAFGADPSQQLASLDGEAVRRLVSGARYLFSNAYERALLESRTSWSGPQVLEQVGVRITTRGGDGVLIEDSAGTAATVAVVPAAEIVDPTGVGDAFRAGFLGARSRGLGLERSAQLGCLLATLVLETVGPQEYTLRWPEALPRLASAYGEPAAADIAGAFAPSVGASQPGQ